MEIIGILYVGTPEIFAGRIGFCHENCTFLKVYLHYTDFKVGEIIVI